MLLSGDATIFVACIKSFRAFIAVMLSESSQVSKQSDAFANPFVPFPKFLCARSTTLTSVLRYYLDIYVGVIIMSLGVSGDHLVI